MNPQPLLTYKKVLVARGSQTVLEVDDLQVFRGETLAVIGPNGAGKSTLLLTASGLLPPRSGSLTIDDRNVYSEKMLDYRRRIALVLQDPLLTDTTVYENVASGLKFRHKNKNEIQARVLPWLERLNIGHLSKRRARSLSGGEAQRTCLARALVLEPDLLLLDEPFSALDAPTRTRLLQDFQNLVREYSLTTLLVTHDLDEALQLGDRVAVLLQGRLRQTGAPDKVFNAPLDAEIASFVGVDTVIKASVTGATNGLLHLHAGAFELQAVGQATIGQKVLLCLRPEDITLWAVGEVPQSSARNRMSGKIVQNHFQGALVRVVVDCGFPVMALITRSSWLEMGIEEGSQVLVSFKATAGHILPR